MQRPRKCHTNFHQNSTIEYKLVITGLKETPVVLVQSYRDMIATSHEEPDNIIVQQALQVASDELKHVIVLVVDTDVYALIFY